MEERTLIQKQIFQVAVKKLGYSGAVVALYLGIIPSLVKRYAGSEMFPDLDHYL